MLHFIHPWFENKDFARSMVSTREISRFAEGPMAQSCFHVHARLKAKPRIRAQSTSKVAKMLPEIGSRRTSNLAKTSRKRTTRLSRQQWLCTMQRTNSDEDDFDYGALTDRTGQRDQCVPNRFINYNTIVDVWTKAIMVRSSAILLDRGHVTRLVGLIRCTTIGGGYLSTK